MSAKNFLRQLVECVLVATIIGCMIGLGTLIVTVTAALFGG